MIPKHINEWLKQWVQGENHPILHHPYRVKDCLVVLGECTGVVVHPSDNNFLFYEFIGEDDNFYYDLRGNQEIRDVYWMQEDIRCLSVAWNYVTNNATPNGYGGWELPWKN